MGFLMGFLMVFLWFSYGFLMVFLWEHSKGPRPRPGTLIIMPVFSSWDFCGTHMADAKPPVLLHPGPRHPVGDGDFPQRSTGHGETRRINLSKHCRHRTETKARHYGPPQSFASEHVGIHQFLNVTFRWLTSDTIYPMKRGPSRG
jgi:hypothetical protein